MKHFDLAIVGYGPTGLMLASLLGQQGHKVIVLERWPQLYGMARLTHIDGETARLLSFGCDLEDALRDSSPIASYKFLNAKGRELLDASAIAATPMGHPDHISIFQPHIEDALDARIKSCANVTVLQGYEVTGLSQEQERVTLTYKPKDGDTASVSARYVFGSDGARSFVRKACGIKQDDDFGFNERWLNIDGIYHGTLDPVYNQAVQHCDPARGRMSMPIGHERRRIEFGLLPGEDSEEMMKDETVAKLLKQHFNLDFEKFAVERKLVYQFESKTAKTWRKGNVFLGGDAAHTMPPYLGQGACSGIRDAANFAWKLDLVLRKQAPDSLLNTYEAERRPHVSHIQKAAVGFGKVANTHNKLAAFIRDIVFRLNILPPPPPFPPLGAGIKQDATGKHYAKEIGGVPPHGQVEIEGHVSWFDTVSGYAFSIITKGDVLSGLTTEQKEFLDTLGCKLFVLENGAAPSDIPVMCDLDQRFTGFLVKTECSAMILRPDNNLFGLAQTAAELSALVDELRQTLGGST